MSTKNSRSSADSSDTNATAVPLNLLADLSRRQLALLTQSTSQMLRGSEALQKIQQQAAHRASAHHEEAAQRLSGPCDINDLLAIQSELVRFNIQEATQYWQQLTSALLKVQVDMASTAGQAIGAGSEPTLESLQRAFEATLNGTGTASTTH